MRLALLLLLLLVTSCSLFFGGKDELISAKGDQYQLNFNSPDWSEKKQERSDYVFVNKDGRILLSTSFCNEFQEEPLERLAEKTFNTVDGFKIEKGEYTTYQNREAYRVDGNGHVDGIKVNLSVLNTRRNNCYFDFVSISPKNVAKIPNTDFDNFLSSVVFK